jgi:hypothetical protein
MDTFNFDFDTDSTLTNDTNSNQSNLDWNAFQSTVPPPPPSIITTTTTINNPFSPNWLSQQDDAVAPDNRSNIMTTPHDDGIYFEIERFFSGLNQQQQEFQHVQEQGIIEPIHMNIQIPNQTNYIESLSSVNEQMFSFYYYYYKYFLASNSFAINN